MFVDYLFVIIFNILITENIKGIKIFYINNKMFYATKALNISFMYNILLFS